MNSNSRIISTDEDPSLRIESSAIINLRGVSTKLNKYKVNIVSRNIFVRQICAIADLYLLYLRFFWMDFISSCRAKRDSYFLDFFTPQIIVCEVIHHHKLKKYPKLKFKLNDLC